MEVIQNRVRVWKWLKSQLNLVRDKDLKNAMLAEFRMRAEKEWGYNPDTGYVKKQEDIVLDDWQKELLDDIEKAIEYEIDTRLGKREQTEKEARVRMLDFIRRGGKYSDLPEDLQNEVMLDLYLDVMLEEIKSCIEFLEK